MNIEAFAVDIDGVLVKDTFSPVICKIIKDNNKEYAAEVEAKIFSRPQKEAAEFAMNYLGLSLSIEESLKYYFRERELYIRNNPAESGLMPGIGSFLEFLKSCNKRMICYGGLPKDYYLKILGEYTRCFEDYICTNEFRPGIQEIVRDYFKLDFSRVLFFDDVCSVAIEAKKLGVPFIGVPSNADFSFQKKEMIANGISVIVDSIEEVDEKTISAAVEAIGKQGEI
jgi:beta-phosphoglucomutase-like phosphatase (HAD superfamily)